MISRKARHLLENMNNRLEEKISPQQRAAIEASKQKHIYTDSTAQNFNTLKESHDKTTNSRQRRDLERALENFRRSNSLSISIRQKSYS